jgi:hypothetical protein
LKRAGFFRALAAPGELVEIGETVEGLLDAEGRLPLVVGRFAVREDSRPEIAAAVETGFADGRARRGGSRRRRAHFPARPALPGMRPGVPRPDVASLRVQLAARRLPRLPGIRAGHRRRPRESPPRPGADARGPPRRSVEHAGVRVGVRRPLSRLPALLGAHRHPSPAPVAARARRPGRWAGRLLRNSGILRLAGNQAVQDPRARSARALPRLHALPRLPGSASCAAGSLGPLARPDDRGALGAPAVGSGPVAAGARSLSVRSRAALLRDRGDPLARPVHERRRSRLSDALPRRPDSLGRRGAAHRARVGSGRHADRHALRAGRADHRSPRRGHAAPARHPPAARGPRQHRRRRRSTIPRRSRCPTT